MLEISWALEGEEDDGKQDDIRLRGSITLKQTMERIAAIQTVAMKEILEKRKGMSANRLWLTIGSGFVMAFIASFGKLPEPSDDEAVRRYAEKVADAMKKHAEKAKKQK